VRPTPSIRTLPVRSLVVDFDGTICPDDVSDRILLEFVGPLARALDLEYERGEIGSRENLVRTAASVGAAEDELLGWALDRFRVDPGFAPFVEWTREVGLDLTVVSDGIGIHIEPMLRAAGVQGLRVVSNYLRVDDRGAHLDFPFGHPICRECGTCKMLAAVGARETRGPVAFVGDGHSDRYGALYSDLVFAKGHLAERCRADGVPFVEWATFADVRLSLEQLSPEEVPGPVEPAQCPGWRTPDGGGTGI
jgi:2-hydroxy-3-keto-5-methylthiopentenyl-1-phosphate phosphatase